MDVNHKNQSERRDVRLGMKKPKPEEDAFGQALCAAYK
jgi:hypothetical protein